MGAVQATQEPIFARGCRLHAGLFGRCICLDKVISHLDSWLRRRVPLDVSIRVCRKPRAAPEVSSLRRMVFSDLVVQLKFPSKAMRSLRLTQV